ncbi:MAG: hypothetical protein MHM6MM_007530 [Cercozoa sp. M6MM]
MASQPDTSSALPQKYLAKSCSATLLHVCLRLCSQCSKFGAMLDMLTDRMSTCGLLIVLARLYPDYWQVFALLIVLDTVSHWMQMDSRLMSGAKSHKGARNALLNFYYTFPFALLFFCVGAEAFLIALFVKAHTNDQEAGTLFAQINTFMTYTAYVCMPVFGMKQLFNVIQLQEAAELVASFDDPRRKSKKLTQ